MSLLEHSIKELEEKLHNKEITAEDLVKASFDRIKEVEEHIHAFITLDEENALQQAKTLNENPEAKSLFGLPIGLQDNIVTKELRTTSGSRMLENFHDPLYDATAVKKLKEEKAITVGKLNMDEFSIGFSTETSAFQTTKNPWNTDCVPGGAGGGAAAAVAAGEVLFALGSDNDGSIRQPASYCGVVGMKPSYGRVSRFGLVASASSMEQIGPVTRTVEDNARVLEVIAGEDFHDSTTVPADVPAYTEALKKDVKGLKIAVPKEFLDDSVSEEVKSAVQRALEVYESLGATWEEVSLPHLKYALPTYYILSSAEAFSGLARYDGVRYGHRSEKAKNMVDMYTLSRSEGFGEEVKRRILFGTLALSSGYFDEYYTKAQKVRTLIKQDFEKIFEEYDVILGPTTPTTAFKIGENNEDPVAKYDNEKFVVPANLAGVPALSLPCGFSEAGLPIGLQIIGKHFAEETVYRVGYAFEQATDFHKQRPNIGGGAQ